VLSRIAVILAAIESKLGTAGDSVTAPCGVLGLIVSVIYFPLISIGQLIVAYDTTFQICCPFKAAYETINAYELIT
jgi:hypothetical protein